MKLQYFYQNITTFFFTYLSLSRVIHSSLRGQYKNMFFFVRGRSVKNLFTATTTFLCSFYSPFGTFNAFIISPRSFYITHLEQASRSFPFDFFERHCQFEYPTISPNASYFSRYYPHSTLLLLTMQRFNISDFLYSGCILPCSFGSISQILSVSVGYVYYNIILPDIIDLQ